MEIRLPSALLPTPGVPTKGITNLLAQLHPGQALDARVEAKLSATSYLLSLGDSGPQLRARSSLDLTPGQLLKLEVIKLGDTPQLRLLLQTVPDDPATHAIRQAIRAFLPRQVGLNELAGALRETLMQPATTPTTAAPRPLPAQLQTAIRAVLDSLPKQADLATPAGLKKALENSGIFLESHLARFSGNGHPAFPKSDLKSQLLNLAKQLEPYLAPAKTTAASPDSNPASSASPSPTAQASKPNGTQTLPPGTPSSTATENASPPQLALAPAGAAPTSPSKPAEAPPSTEATASSQILPKLAEEGDGSLLDKIKRILLGVATPPPDEPPPTTTTAEAHSPLPPDFTASRAQTELLVKAALDPSTKEKLGTGPTAPTPTTEMLAKAVQDLGADTALPELRNLLHKTEGALARIALDQLASQPQADGKHAFWQVEIPYTHGHHGDAAKLRITREHKNTDGLEQAYWSVVLELHPPGLSSVHSRITLAGGRIDSYFWSDSASTEHLIEAHLDLLAARLQHAGLEIGELHTLPGAPAESGENAALPLAGLLSERA